MGSSSNRYAPRLPQQEAKSSTKLLAPTDPILGPENLLKTGFAQKGLPSITGGTILWWLQDFCWVPLRPSIGCIWIHTGFTVPPFSTCFFCLWHLLRLEVLPKFSNSSTNFPALVDVKGVAGPDERKSQPGSEVEWTKCRASRESWKSRD